MSRMKIFVNLERMVVKHILTVIINVLTMKI